MRIAVLGGGVMGETLVAGLLALEPRPEVVIAGKRPERAEELAQTYGVSLAEPAAAVEQADVVILVVKPQDTPALLAEVGALIEPGAVVVSIAAGIRTETIEAAVPEGVHVVRAMPNTPARVGRGVTGISSGNGCSADSVALVVRLLGSVGVVEVVPEELQDAVTAVSGSGPAYLFYLAEAMTAAAVELGIDEATATSMVNQTLLGAATLLATADDPATELRRKVTSPGGTTAAAVSVLDDRGVAHSVVEAITAARDRGRELSGS
jgi:pyrroline-5-carboxylate reductase